jgi:hypothetical protein
MRVQSNTTQSGSFMVTQANTVMRNYYKNNETYTGLKFLNSSNQGTDYAMNSFFLGDLSINRNWSISPMAQSTLSRTDLAFKLSKLDQIAQNSTLPQDIRTLNPFLSQFTEDWLLFTPLADLPNANGNQITFEIFFDYSDIQFYTPMLPLIASTNTDFNKQILNVSATIFNKNFTSKQQAVWGTNTLTEREVKGNSESSEAEKS